MSTSVAGELHPVWAELPPIDAYEDDALRADDAVHDDFIRNPEEAGSDPARLRQIPQSTDTGHSGNALLAEFVDTLSDEQAGAALEFDSPVLMLSGAGSGKTRSLVGRIAKLLAPVEQGGFGVDPDSIMVVTFTNKAAREMRDRLRPIIAELEERGVVARGARNPLWIGTFHSLSMQILRSHAQQAGLQHNFTILDPGSEKDLAEDALKAAGFNMDETSSGQAAKNQIAPEAFLELVERAKNQALSPEFIRAEIETMGGLDDTRLAEFENPQMLDAYQHYQDALRRDNCVDFADLLNRTIELFREKPLIAGHWRSRLRHFMVDEFQDVNPAQMQWLATFMRAGEATPEEEVDVMYADRVEAWPRPTIALAGDEDQTIYTFRGSDVSIILDFEKYFPDGVVRKLETNYRCQPMVLDAANRLIEHNVGRRDKVLRPHDGNPPAEPVKVLLTNQASEHAASIVENIRERIAQGAEPAEFAILARTSSALKEFADLFTEAGIEHRVHGSADLTRREEVRDIMAYAELLANPDASMAFRRICNKPARKISSETVQKIKTKAIALNLSSVETARMVANGGVTIEGMKDAPIRALSEFFDMIETLRHDVAELPPHQALRVIMARTGYEADLVRNRDKAGSKSAQRLHNLGEICEIARRFWVDFEPEHLKRIEARDPDNPARMPLLEFHENFMMEGREASREKPAGVSIMTMHASKGLEFDRVYLPFFMGNVTPHANAVGEDDGIEEERRLAYVAFTRARKELVISWPSTNPPWAGKGNSSESEFIREAFGVRARDEIDRRRDGRQLRCAIAEFAWLDELAPGQSRNSRHYSEGDRVRGNRHAGGDDTGVRAVRGNGKIDLGGMFGSSRPSAGMEVTP